MYNWTREQSMRSEDTKTVRIMAAWGIFFACLEIAKQAYMCARVFDMPQGGTYNVWYLPFQLCSMPVYLCTAYAVIGYSSLSKGDSPAAHAPAAIPGSCVTIATFLQDFGLLGGIAALAYREGFTFALHPFLTVHGWIWHTCMILLAVYIWQKGLSGRSAKAFMKATGLFAALSVVAEIINVMLYRFGDCDMFYISPYHISSQPVFHDIDTLIGRPAGIVFYLLCVTAGAGIVHAILTAIKAKRVAR